MTDYWPVKARTLVDRGQLADAMELCRQRLEDQPDLLSGRLAYALALFRSGQLETSQDQFFYVLSLDPDNLSALKYLGDISFARGDEQAALGYYRRVQQLDPQCEGLACRVEHRQTETTRAITLHRPAERKPLLKSGREIPFFTETIGDLYLTQGHPRLAAEVFRELTSTNDHPRLREKLERAERLAFRKER